MMIYTAMYLISPALKPSSPYFPVPSMFATNNVNYKSKTNGSFIVVATAVVVVIVIVVVAVEVSTGDCRWYPFSFAFFSAAALSVFPLFVLLVSSDNHAGCQ